MMTAFRAGLDLGQVSDWSALAIIEYGEVDGRMMYAVRHLQRWRGTPYPALVADVGEILSRPELSPKVQKVQLVVDATGVGKPIVDLFRAAYAERRLHAYPQAVTITGAEKHGDAMDPNNTTAPKRDLVANLEVVLAEKRLQVADNLHLAKVLREELLNFRAKISNAGHAAFEAGGSGHDDLVISLLLAIWRAPMSSERVQKLANLNRSLRTDNTYDRIGGAERWRMGRVN